MMTLKLLLPVALLLFLPAILIRFLLRWLHPLWWRLRTVRIASALLCLVAPLCALVPLIPYDPKLTDLVAAGYTTMLLVIIWEVLLVFIVPGVAILRWLITLFSVKGESAPDPGRRRFLQLGLAAIPGGALAVTGAGIVEAALGTRVYVREIGLPNLPHALQGMRILHLTDLHLSLFVTLSNLEGILERARVLKPELILVTGDLMDDLRLLPGALTMLREYGAPLGTWATLGNHEHAYDLDVIQAAFRDHDIPLLVNRSVQLTRGGTTFTLGGIDDPKGAPLGERAWGFYNRVLTETFADSGERFRLLMSHRPRVFDLAPDHDVDLVLAGHTHGGQAALLGHSWKEFRNKHPYPWGEYRRGTSRLYVSSGAGQWIPFRLGCPAEAPVIELHRS